jgi:hypothetical protein
MLDLTQLLGGIKPIKVVLLFMLVWSQNARVARVRLFVRNYCSNGTQVANLVPPQTPIIASYWYQLIFKFTSLNVWIIHIHLDWWSKYEYWWSKYESWWSKHEYWWSQFEYSSIIKNYSMFTLFEYSQLIFFYFPLKILTYETRSNIYRMCIPSLTRAFL